ncbi:CHAT domain-containing protein [Dactylosporangium vinaceum]|uniref:CHAT domain-containing protein n=1 Tax=Dactylosporangium vinaceum TaxID=53362 RepID=UPI001CA8B603|nr:CHAT domain-containing protein [Dactylosporangium vinaceum]
MIQPHHLLVDAAAALAAVDRDPGSGLPLAERAARRAVRAGHAAAASTAERAWGHALLHRGDLAGAVRHLGRAVAWGTRAGSPELTAEARHKLAFAVLQRGRPQAALREVDAALPDLTGVAAARARAQRGIVLHNLGRLDEALGEYDTALRVLRREDDRLGVQRMLINRALVHADRHAFAAAARDLAEAEQLARELGRPLTIGLIANNLGLMETLRGDVPAALRHLDRAERIIGAHGAQLGTLHQDRAELLLSAGLTAEARLAAERAVSTYRREHRHLKVPEVQLLLAQAELLAGDPGASGRHAAAARRGFRAQDRAAHAELARLRLLQARVAGGARPRVPAAVLDAMLATLATAGWPGAATDAALVAAGLVADGRPYLARAAAAARSRGPALVRARGWYARALQCRAAGDGPGTLAATRAGLRILDEHGWAMGATDLRVHAAAHRADLAALGLETALATGRAAAQLEFSERARASRLPATPVRPPDDPVLTELLARLRAVTRELAERPGARLLARQAALERRIRDRSRHVTGGSAGAADRPASARALGSALGEWGLVEYTRSNVITIVDGRIRVRPLGEIGDLVDRITFAATRLDHPATAALLKDAAARLDARLLGPLPEVRGRPLVVVPTGPLHSLPWSLLPSCAGRPVTVAPSATLWLHAHARAAGGGPVVAVAGPRLTAAAPEAEAVAALHGGTALTGAAATVEATLAALGTAGLVHLAAHGRLSADNPLFCDIALADGPLVVYDVERLPRVPHTLVLAACASGRPVVRTGDELMGLGVAFLARGAAQLIAPVLPVPDLSTRPLMIAFHRGLAAGRAPAAALADAALRHPEAAGFVCIGAGFR